MALKSSCGNCRNCMELWQVTISGHAMPWWCHGYELSLLSPCYHLNGTIPQGKISTRLGMIPQGDADFLKVEDHEAEAGVCYCPGAPWCPIWCVGDGTNMDKWDKHLVLWKPNPFLTHARLVTSFAFCFPMSPLPFGEWQLCCRTQALSWTEWRFSGRHGQDMIKDFNFFAYSSCIYIWYGIIYLRYLKIYLNIICDTFSLGFQDL